jgi:16S rRNA (guanine966-N2)-methyltransferase
LRDGGWLEKDALVLVEESAQADVPLPEGFALLETRRYGDTQVLFVRAM